MEYRQENRVPVENGSIWVEIFLGIQKLAGR
jgi:hypothetical protein